jgi:sterol 14-demethylase
MVKDIDKAMRFRSKTVVDPFQVMYRLVYQLTHRSFGCKDVAEDEALLQRTIRHYRCMDECSPWQVLFPELPIPAKVIKRWRGLQLFFELRRVIHARRKGGIRSDDAMQVLMDSGKSDIEICSVSMNIKRKKKANLLTSM